MALDLVTVDLALSVVLKVLLLGLLVYTFFILKNIDRIVKSVGRSTEAIGKTSEKVGRIISVSRYIPFIGVKRKDE